jgi:hypothetical protein
MPLHGDRARELAERLARLGVREEDLEESFVHSGGKGSHRAYARTGERTVLNFQNRRGKIPRYQAEQLIEMIEKYAP